MHFKVDAITRQWKCIVTIKAYVISYYDACLKIVKNTTKPIKKSLLQEKKLPISLTFVAIEVSQTVHAMSRSK